MLKNSVSVKLLPEFVYLSTNLYYYDWIECYQLVHNEQRRPLQCHVDPPQTECTKECTHKGILIVKRGLWEDQHGFQWLSMISVFDTCFTSITTLYSLYGVLKETLARCKKSFHVSH